MNDNNQNRSKQIKTDQIKKCKLTMNINAYEFMF